MTTNSLFRRAHSRAAEARQAAREFHAGIWQPDTALVVFFCSSSYDLPALADELNRLFGDVPLYGCTTAGEIGPGGYCGNSLSGVGFAAAAASGVGERLPLLQNFSFAAGQDFAKSLLQRLETQAPQASPANTFAFLMIDGLSVREEPVVYSFQSVLGNIPLCGGSAGDDRRFARTWVFHGGAFHTDSALLVLLSTPLPFRVFKTQHFVSDTERLVVTEADAAKRVVRELNGLPAAVEYARVLGVTVDQLTPEVYSETPIVVVIDGTDYVRSVQKVNDDGSLTFFCAIDEGLVLRVAHADDIIGNLQEAFARVRAEIGPLQLCIGCDCILRSLEIGRKHLTDQAAELFDRNNTIGFSTYGEQFGGVHVNQTFTGIAIGTPLESDDA